MKLSELYIKEEETISAEDGYDRMQVADDQDEAGTGARDIAHKEKLKIMKIGRGENFKKAKSIVANAKADARATDVDSDDTPMSSGLTGGIEYNNMRLT